MAFGLGRLKVKEQKLAGKEFRRILISIISDPNFVPPDSLSIEAYQDQGQQRFLKNFSKATLLECSAKEVELVLPLYKKNRSKLVEVVNFVKEYSGVGVDTLLVNPDSNDPRLFNYSQKMYELGRREQVDTISSFVAYACARLVRVTSRRDFTLWANATFSAVREADQNITFEDQLRRLFETQRRHDAQNRG